MEGSRCLGGGAGEDDSSGPNGLKFGKKIYFEDLGNTQTPSSSSSSLSQMKDPPPPTPGSSSSGRRGRGMGQSGEMQQPPRCQVEGCGQDLTSAKAYYRRHKVCGAHSKSPKVTVAGIEQRFCQQCSRFQQLPEFDQGKRSCRRRLAGHNERRRKPPSGPFSSRYGQLSSSSFHISSEDGGRFGGYLMDFSRPRLPGRGRDTWAATGTGGRLMTSDQWIRSTQVVSPYITHGGSTPGGGGGSGLFSGHEIPPDECLRTSDSSCALSLLSTQQWGTTTTTTATVAGSSNYGATLSMMGQTSNPTSFLDNPWSTPNRYHHHSNNPNPNPPRGLSMSIPVNHTVGFGDPMEPSRGQISDEPEHGRRYDPSSGGHLHWPAPH